jgi:hypothetical protein
MSQLDPEFWDRATRARDKLVEQFIRLPGVNMVDIGVDPEDIRKEGQPLVLRIHVDRLSEKEKLGIPDEMNGIPVRVIVASYRPD